MPFFSKKWDKTECESKYKELEAKYERLEKQLEEKTTDFENKIALENLKYIQANNKYLMLLGYYSAIKKFLEKHDFDELPNLENNELEE